MALSGPSVQSSSLLLSNVPFDKKWDHLKPHIMRLYIDEGLSLSEVISTMKREFDFNANESSYKYYINRKWKLKKSIPASKKLAMCNYLQTRANAGKQTALTYKGKGVDLHKLRRVMKEDARKQTAMRAPRTGTEAGASNISHIVFPAGNRIFLNWNVPYGAIPRIGGTPSDGPSPAAMVASTPSDVVAVTPSSADAPSPNNAPSPMSAALRHKAAAERATLFLQGRHRELLHSMNRVERRSMSTWLYQFWLFSFQTAKNWGRGPRNWTAELLRFDDFHDPISIMSPNTLVLTNPLWAAVGSPRNVSANTRVFPSPSPLCRWAIHVPPVGYVPIPSPPAETFDNPYGEGSWRAWENSKPSPSFEETLTNGLESNDFSTFRVSDLPVAVPQIAEATRRSPSELLVEALGFSIMGRNADLTDQLTEKLFNLNEKDHGDFYPFHLATSYLDGSRTCCNLLDLLVSMMPPKLSIRQTYTNNLGHTILDNLMICILKSHSSCAPGDVDDVWQKEKRFAGEEVDICGRWDADSDCVRSLLANGEAIIPFEWKHKFCHTSAQAICHCINTIFFPSYAEDINTASGLFVKRCLNCGFKLQLKPLHTLVLTALALAQQGAAGEDLLGILACALCLLWNGADASLTAKISLDLLLHGEQTDHCSHKELSPADLAELLASQYQIVWTKDVRIGWQIFCYLLRSSCEEWILAKPRANKGSNYNSFGHNEMEIDRDSESDAGSFGMDDECCEMGKGCCYFGRNEDLGRIYAAVQTELATYRRIAENDPWTSTNFNMEELLQSLLREHKPRIGLLEKGLLKSFCRCGLFYDNLGRCLTAEDACVSYFMNMDVWSRASFIDMPERNYE